MAPLGTVSPASQHTSSSSFGPAAWTLAWAALAISIAACARVPEGYYWPQHTNVGSGAASGIEGILSEVNGCIYVTREPGPPDLVIWPPFASLGLVDGEPVVAIQGKGYSMGDTIFLGGGELTNPADLPEAVTSKGDLPCPGPYWLASGLAD